MKITQAILDKLTEEAKKSPRFRMNLDLSQHGNARATRYVWTEE